MFTSVPQQTRSFLDLQGALPALGGHRGMGANVIRGGSLAPVWRENTIRSFQAAAASGATFVEFDVQVTSDGVPVIWHDNFVEYGDPSRPTQCAIADLTAAEFQALGSLSASGKCQKLAVVRRFKRAAPAGASGLDGAAILQAVAAAAADGSAAGADFSAAARQRWCCEADDGFPTLEQLFSTLPPQLAFNIEVKMATPDELAATPEAEIQRMVGPILDVVGRCGGDRQVVFSCFDPDVCRALQAAQERHSVMFLSAGGRDWHADPRRMSIAAAIDEACSYKLSGVVVDSGALRRCPGAAELARSRGLKLLTYGLENDSVEWVLCQQRMGVTGVIVDDLQGLMAVLGGAGRDGAAMAAGFMEQMATAAAAVNAVQQAPAAMPSMSGAGNTRVVSAVV
ncbi:Glycerophosphoryl diester phosphodiesterase family-domain-containing protein [Scenedesmus sp. NREL 46B-D3]|nr:Glycerophosphoryl diester phosphodiesterase family-domain-containing protein [Scenedesmus sp. NREL 46B-D3]